MLNKENLQKINEMGHFEVDGIIKYFEENVSQGSGINIAFTNNGFYDLEKCGLSGVGLWIGYEHKKGQSRFVMKKNLEYYVQNTVQDALVEYKKKNNILGRIFLEDHTYKTDMWRVYISPREYEDNDTETEDRPF